jgi:hypothetical protein
VIMQRCEHETCDLGRRPHDHRFRALTVAITTLNARNP